ncbi:flagellar biosynthesis anti-sigma factor FlgM [Thiomicrorhabdus sediminis]|uniref:Negative regulator of flagellin synthesis n=1 Tax=Thiomicrorhabdus sediminis TaxID=2580412 RepID=A0A4P9K7Z1_9GAMM|nr:flagellar biosynthesis anti-sigma factor FlgM [Thiomicrorhabdus sediminis]QCU90496.1 flagellar biosynthesis anti-sigma factor FlgM [Thiomicrorhabdus sediminis]
MDIKNLTNNIGANRANDSLKSPTKEGGSQASGTQTGATDRVTLTDVLSQVRELESRSKEVSVDNSERIAQIKAAINNGSYNVDAEKIAQKLIQTEALFSKV